MFIISQKIIYCFIYIINYVKKLFKISKQHYSLIETGKIEVKFEKMIKLALLYDTSLDYIAGLTNKKRSYKE